MRLGADIAHAARVLADGGLVAFPTETVYGLGADATSAAAVARIYAAKGRPTTHPVIVHLASADELAAFGAESRRRQGASGGVTPERTGRATRRTGSPSAPRRAGARGCGW